MQRFFTALFALCLCVGCAGEIPASTLSEASLAQEEPAQVEYSFSGQDTAPFRLAVEQGMHTVFDGYIGESVIRMDIFREGDALTAYYMVKGEGRETALNGEIVGDAVYLRCGEMPAAIYLKATEQGTFQGIYTDERTGEVLPVHIGLVHATVGNSATQRYLYDAELVENLTAEIQRCIAADDRAGLAEIVRYPITLYVGKEPVEIATAEAFVEQYEAIVNPAFAEEMLAAWPRYLFHNYQGMLFGGPALHVWLDGVEQADGTVAVRITAINNMVEVEPRLYTRPIA